MHETLDRQRDEQILMALHLVENVGLTHKDAAHLVGMTKNACIGAIARVRNEPTGVHSILRNPANKDRSQRQLWWFDPTSEFGLSVLDKIDRLKERPN
jgi:uracil phosphoribosyltransferase